ncbi:MAG: pyridoxal phosphate-dependent aminotransferase [Gammaproteobacteria bacterium]|nr:pyridoxal phosphate-dependent aminotransferase [Gammaproteobacteria bacterium]
MQTKEEVRALEVKPSQRAQSVRPSPTMAISAKAAELKRAGKDILSLAAGEPDFDTPEHVKAAAIVAINDGFTKYTAVDGTLELKHAIIEKFERENNLRFSPEQILVSNGCKHSIYNLMQALLNDGDEVIIPAPYWVSYPDMARLAGAEPVILRTGIANRFKINAEQLRGALGERSRLLILNSPSNPSGSVYTRFELEALGAVLIDFPDVVVATDDIYEHILWTGEPFINVLNAVPQLHERTVVLNGVSKAYAMTGWRIGYAAGPASLIATMKKIQSQSTSNPTSIAQVAATAALNGDQSSLAEQSAVFKQRHDFVIRELDRIEGVEVEPSAGTFYTFPDMSGVIERAADIDDDMQLAEYLLDKAGVAGVPGSAFGAAGCMRFSYATSMDVLKDAMTRLQEALT